MNISMHILILQNCCSIISIEKLDDILLKFSIGGNYGNQARSVFKAANNELIIRGCAVDIGIVYGTDTDKKGRTVQVPREIDFVATIGGKRVYIQSAYALPDEAKAEIENRPFGLTGDSFPKIIVRHDIRKRWYDDHGVLNIGIIDFLLDQTVL